MAWSEERKLAKSRAVFLWWAQKVREHPEDFHPCRVRRVRLGITQATLAHRAGVNKEVIVRLEAGKRISKWNYRRVRSVLDNGKS